MSIKDGIDRNTETYYTSGPKLGIYAIDNLKWCTAPPTEPGLYLVDKINGKNATYKGKIVPHIVFFRGSNDILGFGTESKGNLRKHFLDSRWLGPLPVQEMPK